jgi:hypothetical protein
LSQTQISDKLDNVNGTHLFLGLGFSDAGDSTAAALDLAELVLYDRALTSEEMTEVWNYFMLEYAPERPPPELVLLTPQDGSTVYGSSVFVSWRTMGDTSQSDHVHLTLDGGEIIMVYNLNSNYTYTDMLPGVYQLEVALYTSNHSPLESDRSAAVINFVVAAATTISGSSATATTSNVSTTRGERERSRGSPKRRSEATTN